MINAKDEFLEHVGERAVKCAALRFGPEYFPAECKFVNLRADHGAVEWNLFLAQIDFRYDDGYGGQELFGNIWYHDGTWSERGEYDGSEWWEYKACPPIPEALAGAAPAHPGEEA